MAEWALLIYFTTAQVYLEDRTFTTEAECEAFVFTQFQEYAMREFAHINEWIVPGCYQQAK